MPDKEAEDRAHNFFAREELSSGHQRSLAADGSWQGLGNNPWAGSQQNNGLSSSNSKDYSLQQSDIQRGQNSHSLKGAGGLNYGRSTLSPELANSSQSQSPNSNGYMHGRQILQTKQNETNNLGVDSESNPYTLTSRGSSVYESHGGNGFENEVGSVRPEASGVNFFGSQQLMSGQKVGMLQSLPQHQAGYNGMHPLQQQVMLRKMQELQRQHLESTQCNSLNQNPSIINGSPISPITVASNDTWPTEPSAGNKSWLQRAAQASQGPSNEFRFPQEQDQTLSLMGLIPQQVDQSQYRVPVSYTRDRQSHNPCLSVDKHQMEQMAMYSNSSTGGQYAGPTDHVNGQDGSLSSRHGFQERNFFLQPSSQGPARSMYLGNPQLVDSLQTDGSVHELAGPSETGEAKAVLPISSSQNAVALDPTEEKILFGDENIWDSFGNSDNPGAGGGCWSALMQSAVAETSSNIGLQEQWSGPSIQNIEAAVDPRSDNNINKKIQDSSGFQQFIPNYPYEHGDKVQMDSTLRSSYHSSEEGSLLLSRGPLQHNVPSHNSGQLYGKPNGQDEGKTLSSNGNERSRFCGSENKLQLSGSAVQTRTFHEEITQGVHMWKMVPGSQSAVGLKHVRTSVSSPPVNREDASFNNYFGRPSSNTARASERTGPDTSNPVFWKHAESSKMDKGNDHHLNMGSLVLESSMNSPGYDLVNMHEIRNIERKENSSDSYQSNISQHTTASGSYDKIRLDGSDTQNFLGGKQKVSGQGGHNVSGPRYHVMGDLDEDVESSLGRKDATNNQVREHLRQSKNRQFPNNSSKIVEGQFLGVQQNKNGVDDSPSRGNLIGFAPNISAPFDKNFGIHASGKADQPSQNVVEFLHGRDQSKEDGNSDGSVGTLKQSRSPSSHGFALQLGFPSQLLSAQNHVLSSYSAAQLVGSIGSSLATPGMREKDDVSKTSGTQAECFPSFHETSEGEFRRNEVNGAGSSNNHDPTHNMLGKLNSASNSEFPFSRNQFQGQQMIGAVDRHDPHYLQTWTNQKDRPLSSVGPSQLTDALASREKVDAKEISMSRTGNTWTRPPSQHHVMNEQSYNKFPPSAFRPGQLNNHTVSISSSQQVGTYREGQQPKGSLHQLVSSSDLAPKPSGLEGKQSVLVNQHDASPSNSASTERDFEAFGRSLKPNNLSQQTSSLINQMRVKKSNNIDPSERDSKRLNGAESSAITQMRQRKSNEKSIMVGDPQNLSFAGSADSMDTDSPSRHANVLSQDVLVPDRMDSGNHPSSTNTSTRVENSHISPQMAPSWFKQYGTLKNSQMSMHDAHKYSTLKTNELRLPLGKSPDTVRADDMMKQANAAAVRNQAGNIWPPGIHTRVNVENLPSSNLIAHNVVDKGLVVERQKKRKIVGRLPWHKKITQGSQSLVSTSMAAVEWAEEANRLIDKVEDDPNTFEDGLSSVRSKRRLIFTTHLMQQIFRPPVASILSADAYSNYEAVACMGAQLTLGDACGLIPFSHALDGVNSLTDKHQKTESERINGQHLFKVMEHYIGRAKKLENDFMRLDKRTSMIDLRVESQDLEKVSMVNRFARFHGHGQANLASPGPQRYVNALPIPRFLPERVQCLPI